MRVPDLTGGTKHAELGEAMEDAYADDVIVLLHVHVHICEHAELEEATEDDEGDDADPRARRQDEERHRAQPVAMQPRLARVGVEEPRLQLRSVDGMRVVVLREERGGEQSPRPTCPVHHRRVKGVVDPEPKQQVRRAQVDCRADGAGQQRAEGLKRRTASGDGDEPCEDAIAHGRHLPRLGHTQKACEQHSSDAAGGGGQGRRHRHTSSRLRLSADLRVEGEGEGEVSSEGDR